MLLLYQALGNARISLRRRMSYLKEAEPMSQTAGAETERACESRPRTCDIPARRDTVLHHACHTGGALELHLLRVMKYQRTWHSLVSE